MAIQKEEGNGKKYVNYPWLVGTALVCCSIILVVLGLFLDDLQHRLEEIKAEFPKKLDTAVYIEHLTRTAAIEVQLDRKVNVDLFALLCADITEMKKDVKDLVKAQQRRHGETSGNSSREN